MGKLATLSPFVCGWCSGQHFHDDGGKPGRLQLGSREYDEDAFGSLWVAVRMDDYVLLFLRDLCMRADAV